jgi:CheY-like chemotaxis protein
MTADAFSEDVQKAREAGMTGHLSKPVDLVKMEQCLSR